MGGKTLYKVFSVAEKNTILPPGGVASNFIDRITGDRIVEVIDTNENGRPDSGDTGIDKWGDLLPNVQFTEEIIYNDSDVERYVNEGFIRNSDIEGEGLTYDVWHVEAASAEEFMIDLAANTQDYFSSQADQAIALGTQFYENPSIVGGVMLAAGLLSLHPAGRAALMGIGALGSVYGGGSIVIDRIEGITTGKKMGQHDLDNFLWMFGGAAAFEPFMLKAAQAGRTSLAMLGSAFRGMGMPPPATVVAGSGAVMSGALGTEAAVAATAASSGGWRTALASLPMLRSLTAEFLDGPKEFDFNEDMLAMADAQKTPKGIRPDWKGSEAEEAALYIERNMADLTEMLGSGTAELEMIRRNLRAMEEIYAKVPAERGRITKALSETEKFIYGYRGDVTSVEFFQSVKNKLIADVHGMVRGSGYFARVRRLGKAAKRIRWLLKPPDEVVVMESGEKAILDLGIETSNRLKRAYEAMAKFTRGEINICDTCSVKFLQNTKNRIFEWRDGTKGPGYRIYFVENGEGSVKILHAGIKDTQVADIATADRLAGIL